MANSKNVIAAEHEELLRQLDEGYAPSWIPEKPGDTIVGTLVRASTGFTSFGPAPVIELVTDDGDRFSVWLFYETLKSEMRRMKPAPGERVAVRYLGEAQVKNQTKGRKSAYHNYRVAVDRPIGSETVDWNAVLGVMPEQAETPEPDLDEPPF